MYSKDLIRKIETRTTINDDTCWIWTGSLNGSGYATITHDGKPYSVHRIMFEYYSGERIPPGYEIHHAVCENRRCIRYDHLALTTPSRNNLLKSALVSKRKERLLRLQDKGRTWTTTALAAALGIHRTNVLSYLRSVANVYDDFAFQIIRKGRGSKPSMLLLTFKPGFFARLAEPEVNWRDQPAFSPLAVLSMAA